MRNAILEELLRADGKSAFFVEAYGVALGMDDTLQPREKVTGTTDPLKHQSLSNTCSTHFLRIDNPSDSSIPVFLEEYTTVRHDLLIPGDKDVSCILIVIVKVLVRAILLDYENLGTKPENPVQFVEGEVAKVLSMYFHIKTASQNRR